MAKYKINLDKPLPDAKRIEAHRNFPALMKRYQVVTRFEFWRKLYKNPLYFASLVAIIAVFYLVIEASQGPKPQALFEFPLAVQSEGLGHPQWQVLDIDSTDDSSPDGYLAFPSSLELWPRGITQYYDSASLIQVCQIIEFRYDSMAEAKNLRAFSCEASESFSWFKWNSKQSCWQGGVQRVEDSGWYAEGQRFTFKPTTCLIPQDDDGNKLLKRANGFDFFAYLPVENSVYRCPQNAAQKHGVDLLANTSCVWGKTDNDQLWFVEVKGQAGSELALQFTSLKNEAELLARLSTMIPTSYGSSTP